MMAARQAVWLFFSLLGLACTGWFFAGSSMSIKLDDHTLSTTNDMTITHLKIRKFDSEGRLANYLQTPLLHHIPTNNTHWLKTPHIVITQQNQPPWDIRAQQATALYGGQQITFNENVVVHQEKDEHNQESTFKTEEITYFPNDQLATTPLEVTLERPGSTVKSTGMKAYLAERRVQLLSQARGTYAPNRG